MKLGIIKSKSVRGRFLKNILGSQTGKTSFLGGADKTPQDKMSQDEMSRQNATQTIRHIDKMSQDKASHTQNVTGQTAT